MHAIVVYNYRLITIEVLEAGPREGGEQLAPNPQPNTGTPKLRMMECTGWVQ